MNRVIVRYEVKPDRVEENERLIRGVYEELAATVPDGLRYATFKLGDGVSFLHIAADETAAGSNPLGRVAAFAEFRREVADRCAVQPRTDVLHEVGSFRFWT